jgi:hypothetical protein
VEKQSREHPGRNQPGPGSENVLPLPVTPRRAPPSRVGRPSPTRPGPLVQWGGAKERPIGRGHAVPTAPPHARQGLRAGRATARRLTRSSARGRGAAAPPACGPLEPVERRTGQGLKGLRLNRTSWRGTVSGPVASAERRAEDGGVFASHGRGSARACGGTASSGGPRCGTFAKPLIDTLGIVLPRRRKNPHPPGVF